MICPFCKAENETSRVTSHGTSSTLMGFSAGYYDEAGTWVRHPDPNWHTTQYSCSRWHQFAVRRREGDEDVVTLISTLTTTHSPR